MTARPEAQNGAVTLDDHKRGCSGRNYICTCGYDAQVQRMRERLRSIEQAAGMPEAPVVLNGACTDGVLRVSGEFVTKHVYDALTAHCLHLADKLARMEASCDAWREFAQHQETCGSCAVCVADCETGTALQNAALLAKLEKEKQP